MKCSYPALLLIMTGGTAFSGAAHEIDACVVADDANVPVCHHYFEGRSIDLPIRKVLDGIDADCDQLVLRVLQRQGMLLAPLDESVDLAAEGCTTMTSIALELPNVRSETDILVQFSTKSSTGMQPGRAQVAAVIAVRVYPDTLLDSLARLAERRPLVVFDSQGKLAAFLDRADIDYVERVVPVSGEPIGILVEPKEAERLLEDRGIYTAIILREKVIDLPQVRAVSRSGRTRIYVEMPILDDLDSSPLAQKALLSIVNLAINADQTDRG